MQKIFKNLLLLALPASGKSEIRKYLSSLDPEARRNDFYIGKLVQLDDFPYVHYMRRIDDELDKLGEKRVFFHSPDKPFLELKTWGALIHLLNEDYDNLMAKRIVSPPSAAERLLKRLDTARIKAGLAPLFFDQGKLKLPDNIWKALLQSLEEESKELIARRLKEYPESFEGRTILIEFARGGRDGADMPIPFGYETCLRLLSPEILENAAVLYVWVTPEESRKKNFEREDPNNPGSILGHSVPIDVMMNEYGCDDINYLLETSDKSGYIKLETPEKVYYIPVCKFDNRTDKTSFIRNDVWREEEKNLLHDTLKETAVKLYERFSEAVAEV